MHLNRLNIHQTQSDDPPFESGSRVKQSTQIKKIQMQNSTRTEYFTAIFRLIFNNVSAFLFSFGLRDQTGMTKPEIARQQKLKALKIKLRSVIKIENEIDLTFCVERREGSK